LITALILLQDTLTHSLLICEVSPELLESLEEDKKVIKQISAIRFDGDLFEQVSCCLSSDDVTRLILFVF
jgi:hypothetical protein